MAKSMRDLALDFQAQNPTWTLESCLSLARDQTEIERLEAWLLSLSAVEITAVTSTIRHADLQISKKLNADLVSQYQALIIYNQSKSNVWYRLTAEHAWNKSYLVQAEILRGIFPETLKYIRLPALAALIEKHRPFGATEPKPEMAPAKKSREKKAARTKPAPLSLSEMLAAFIARA